MMPGGSVSHRLVMTAQVLIAGDKSGRWKEWYAEA
jgi:hypothetical protein